MRLTHVERNLSTLTDKLPIEVQKIIVKYCNTVMNVNDDELQHSVQHKLMVDAYSDFIKAIAPFLEFGIQLIEPTEPVSVD